MIRDLTRSLGSAVIVVVLAAAAGAQNLINVDLITPETQWRYFDEGEAPADWETVEFDDSGWASGAAPLGYGESEVVTRVGFGGNPGARHITTYLRAEFESVGGSEPWQAFSVLATVQRDDGAVIYLNGVEVARQNLPEGVEITHDTLALDEVSGAEEDELHWFDISKDLIRDGKNVIAVRVHQARAGSSDLFFDMALRANRRESRVVTTRKHANVAYLELSHPQRIIRYDLEAREWLEPVPLGEFSGAVESFEVDDDGLFFVTENSLAVWEGGTAPPTVLAELPSEPSSPIVLWGDYAYVTLAAVTSYYKSDGSVAAATSNLPGYSYGRPDDDGTAVVLLGGSFERILRMSFHPDGTITSDLTELLQGAPGGGPCLGLGNGRYIAPNGWLIDGETLDVVGSAGEWAINIQRAAPGTFVSIRFSSNDDVFLALHDPDTLLPTHWTTAEGSRSMFAHDGAAFVFGEPGPAGGSDLTVSRLTPEDFRPGLPVEEPAPLPVGFGSFRSSQMVAKGGTAYMSTDTHVYRWTAEDGFDEPLSLPVRSRDRVFDAARGLLYVERSGGYGVAQIDLEAWTVPQAFAGIPEELLGIQAAGSGLLTLSERLEWSGDSAPARHFGSEGTLLDTLPLEVNVGVSRSHELTWDARNGVVLTGLRMRIPISESGELGDPVPLPIEGAVPRFPSFGAVSPDGTLLVSDGAVMEYPDPVRVLWELPEQVTQYVWAGTELVSIRHPPTGGDSTLVEKRDGQTGEVLASRYFGGLAGALAADGDTLYAQTRQGFDLSVSVTRVIAFRADDLGVIAATPAEPVRPEQPAVISRGTTRLQLGWQNRTDTSEEQVVSYRRTGPVGPWQSITVPGDVSSATVQGLLPDTRYELRVLARNALGSTDWSEIASGETLENVNVPANPPTGLAAVQVFGDAITLVWEDNTDNETGFRVRWSAAGDSGQTEVTADATMARATGLRTGRDYTFTIEAFNDDGTGEPSLPLVVRTLDSVGVPGRVRLSSPTVDGDSVTLTWIDLPNEEGYIVELRGDDGSFAEVARLAFNTTEFFVDGLAGRTSYLFRVRAFNSRGEGVGDEVSASTPRLGGSLSGGFARHAGVHHFGFSEPDRIERFDEGAAAWLDPWPMPGRVQGLAEGDAGMFVTIEDELRPIDPDGGLGEALLAVPDDAVILVTSEYLIVHEGQFAKAYRANDGTPAAETEVRLGLGHLRDGPAPDTLISPDGLHVVAPGGQIVPIPLGGPSISVRSRSFSPDRRMIFGGAEVRSTGSLEQIGRIETQVERATAIGWAPVVYGAASQGLVGYRPDLTRRQSRQLAEEPFLLSANDNAVFAYAADGRDERGMSATIVSASSLGITSTEAPPPSDDGLGFQPRAAFVSGDDLVLLDPDRFRLVRWSMVGSGFGETVPLGGLPMDAVPWGDAGDVMLADVNGAISKIPAGTTGLQPFVDLGAPLFGLEVAGEFLLALGPDPGDLTMYRVYCIDSAGVVTGSIAVPPVWRKLIMHWDAASRRLVYGDEPRWVAISAEGIPNEVGSVEGGEFPSLLHEPAGLAAGGRLVTLEGVVADVSEMPIPERFPTLHYLGDEAVAAVDTGSGTTATISGNLFFSEVTLWGGRALEPLRTIELPGEAVGLVAGEGRIVALTKLGDRVGLHVLRAEDLARSGSSLGDAPPAPSAPANVSVTRENGGGLTVRWGAPETGDVEGYAIFDYFGPGEPTEQVELGRVGPDAFEFELSTLSSQSPRIHVVAFNGSGESAPAGAYAGQPGNEGRPQFSRRVGEVLHVAATGPYRVERFHVPTRSWLPPWPMPGQVTSISEGENRTLVATGRSAWAFDAEGNRSFIANSPSSIGGLLDYRGRALFGTQLGHRSSAADPSMLESLSPVHPWVGLSLVDETLFSFSGNALRRFSEADFSALERRPPDVVTVSSGNGFLRGASRSFPSPDGLLLATGSGEVFHTGDLSWAGYLNGGVQDVVFVDGGLFAVRRTEIVRYDERLLPVGRLEIDGTLGAAADAGDVIVLEADEASANGIRVHTYPFDAFRPPARGGQPEPPPSLNVANTVLFAGGGVLYVARRNPDELYRYAIAERRFLPPLAMLGQPVAGTYRQASGDVLIAYSDGRVTRLDPSTLGETVLMNTAGPVVELEAGGAGILGIGAAITAHSHDGEPLLRTPLVEATATQRVTWPGGVAMSNHIASVRVVFDETGVPAVAGGPGVEFSRDSIVRRDGSRILTRFGAILGVDPVSRLGDHGYTWEKGWWGDQLLTVRHDGGETLAEATDVDAGVTALANRFTGFPIDLVPHADGFVLATSVGPRTQLYFLDHELRTLHSEPAATPVVDLVGDAALNRQTGLYEQRVRFTNDSGAEVSGFRLGLPFLAASYELYNGSGTGEVFFDQPVAAGGSVDLTLEFYSPLRSGFVAGAVSHSTVLRELGAPAPPTAPFAIDRLLVLDDGSALIEFPSEPGVRYFVQTSGDGEGWSDCQFPVRAGGTRVQWIDNGPPKTPSHPSESPGRQYRVIRIDP